MFPRITGPLLVTTLFASSAAAQVSIVFNRSGSGARAAGMANAFIAISDDGTAASWNPAGLGQLRKPEFSIVASTLGRSVDSAGFRSLDGASLFTNIPTSYQSTHLDFASLAVPVTLWKKPVTFQGGWYRLYTLDYRDVASTTRLPVTPGAPPPVRIDSNIDLVGGVDLISIAGAVKLTPRLAIGGSFNFWRGDWDENDVFSSTLVEGQAPSSFATTSNSNRVRGTNVNLGLMLTYPRFSAGIVYQSPLHSDYTVHSEDTSSQAPAPAPIDFAGSLRFPQAVGFGGAWRPTSRWTAALDLTWDNWHEATIESPETGRLNLFDGLPQALTTTRNTLSVNAGAEHLFLGEGFVVPLRFGAAWEPQGARNPYTRDPVNFVMLALGTGYNTNSLKFDAALQYRWAHFQDGDNFSPTGHSLAPPLAVGERDVSEWRLKFSLILRVTDTEKLHRTLGKVFGGG